MRERRCDIAIVGSGAGGGTVALELAPLASEGAEVVLFEQGPRLEDEEFTGRELEMARTLYADGGGFLTEQGTMTLAFGQVYGGSTAVYTGTSLLPPERSLRRWDVPGLDPGDVRRRAEKYAEQNNVHLLDEDLINENNELFVEGCEVAGYEARQFPLNLKGCRGSSLCNLGCPNQAKQGTDRVQLPAAESKGVETVTRAEVRRLGDRWLEVHVSDATPGEKGLPPSWEPGRYRVHADVVVVAGGSVGSSSLLLRSDLPVDLPGLGTGFTCHPAHILVAEHPEEITNDVGHPKSYYVDRADEEGYLLETCMYFPFVTAKNLTGFGREHSRLMRSFPRLQMILVLACDRAVEGNRITVDDDGEPEVRYRFTPDVVRGLTRGTRAAARIFFGAGASRVHAPTADPPTLSRDEADRIDERIRPDHFVPGKTTVSAAHLMGGCGMGEDLRDSVTDDRGRVHGLPWLRVADSSLFPDAVWVNPYLTVMALADRVAEGIREDASHLLSYGVGRRVR